MRTRAVWASFEAVERLFRGSVPTDSRADVEQIVLTDLATEQKQLKIDVQAGREAGAAAEHQSGRSKLSFDVTLDQYQ